MSRISIVYKTELSQYKFLVYIYIEHEYHIKYLFIKMNLNLL